MAYLDTEGFEHFWEKLGTALAGKVDKESGKGLSANDFTDALKTKLNGVEAGANKYTLPAATYDIRGGVRVSDSTSGSGTAENGWAASPVAVKAAYDLANGKQDPLVRGSVAAGATYNAALPVKGTVATLIAGAGLYMIYRYTSSTTGWVTTIVEDSNLTVGMGTTYFSIKNKKTTSAWFMLL